MDRLAQVASFVHELLVAAFEYVQLGKRQLRIWIPVPVCLPDVPKHAGASLLRKFAMQDDDRLESLAGHFVKRVER